MKKFIVIDPSNDYKALYGMEGKTLMFSTYDAADELGKQICLDYIVIEIST